MMFDGSVVMQTAGGETRALGTVNLVDPFGRPIQAHVLTDPPVARKVFPFARNRAKDRS